MHRKIGIPQSGCSKFIRKSPKTHPWWSTMLVLHHKCISGFFQKNLEYQLCRIAIWLVGYYVTPSRWNPHWRDGIVPTYFLYRLYSFIHHCTESCRIYNFLSVWGSQNFVFAGKISSCLHCNIFNLSPISF